MSAGWISIHRQIADNWLWDKKPFAEGQAWIDLLLLAYHEDVQKPYKGTMKTYHRGDVNVSLSFLAKRWGWTRQRVRRFIKLLESAEMVTTSITTNDTTISLVNYDKFQGRGTTSVTAIYNSDHNSEYNNDRNTINKETMSNNDNNMRAKRATSHAKSEMEKISEIIAQMEKEEQELNGEQ